MSKRTVLYAVGGLIAVVALVSVGVREGAPPPLFSSHEQMAMRQVGRDTRDPRVSCPEVHAIEMASPSKTQGGSWCFAPLEKLYTAADLQAMNSQATVFVAAGLGGYTGFEEYIGATLLQPEGALGEARIALLDPEQAVVEQAVSHMGQARCIPVTGILGAWRGVTQFRASPVVSSSELEAMPGLGDLGPAKRVERYSLRSLMAEHGISRIPILKMDIEGSEVAVLKQLLQDGDEGNPLDAADQVGFETHLFHTHHSHQHRQAAIDELVEAMGTRGFRLLSREEYDLTFVREDYCVPVEQRAAARHWIGLSEPAETEAPLVVGSGSDTPGPVEDGAGSP